MATIKSTEEVENETKEYQELLEASFAVSQRALDTIREAQNGGHPNLDEIHKQLVMDTVKVVKKKNEIKNALHDLGAAYVSDKVNKMSRQYNNMKLASLKRHRLSNERLQRQYADLFADFPASKVGQLIGVEGIEDADEKSLLTKLQADMQTVKDAFDNDQFGQYCIDGDEVKRFDELSHREARVRFRLVQLNDKYYDHQISTLMKTKAKWAARVGSIKQYGADAGKLQQDIDRERELLAKEAKEESSDDDDDDDDDDEPEPEPDGVDEIEESEEPEEPEQIADPVDEAEVDEPDEAEAGADRNQSEVPQPTDDIELPDADDESN